MDWEIRGRVLKRTPALFKPFLNYVRRSKYRPMARFHKVIAKIQECSVSPYVVYACI